jgi:hypothetical protein
VLVLKKKKKRENEIWRGEQEEIELIDQQLYEEV